MNYILNTRIENVANFSVGEAFFAYELKGGSLFLNDELLLIKSESYSFIENNFCFYKNGQTHIIKSKRDEIEIINSIITNYNYYFPNKAIITFDGKQDGFIYSSKWSIYQLSPFKKLYDLPHRYIGSGQIYGDISFRYNFERVKLSALSLLRGVYEWEVDLGGRKFVLGGEEQESKISQIIDVIEGNLYVWMSDERLVEIDAKTGKIKTETFPLQILQQQDIIQAVLFPQYYQKEQSLFFFYQDYLVQVHLSTQKTTLIWQDSGYNIGPSFITDNYIYFIGNYQKGTVFRDHVGVFDRQKNEVVWMQQVIELSPKTYDNLKEIQATDDKIYVLDTEGILHIFERDEVA